MSFLNILIVISIMAITGCSYDYSGDGQFTDKGLGVAYNRYELNLGSINACEKGSVEFKVGELPLQRFGIDIMYCSDELNKKNYREIQEKISKMMVGISVFNGSSDFYYKGRLWEYGHDSEGKYFMNGMNPMYSRDSKCLEWGARSDKIGYDFDAGLFNIFRQHEKKNIKIEVLEPLDQSDIESCSLDVYLKGGGWK